jgi:GntP family gluconate:H+ symporter
MPLIDALLLFVSVAALVALAQRRLHPFLAIVVTATAFAAASGFSIGLIGKAFGSGFSQAIYSPGLVIVAAGFVAGLAESTLASDRLMAAMDRWRRLGSTRLAAALGLIAGLGASPASAFALLTPLVRPIAGEAAPKRKAATLALALAISASHGLLALAPVPIAAAAILGADWHRVALFGVPVAVLTVALGAAFARWLAVAGVPSQTLRSEPQPAAQPRSGGSAIVLVMATAIPLLLLIVQSLGDIPSEPLGGGPARELVIGLGRPLILFVVGVGIMAAGQWRGSLKLVGEPTWTGRVLADVSSVLLIVGAAGGLQKLCQETGMAELLGERVADWSIGGVGGLLIPFLIAAVIKTLQGSSLVAAITAAGMMQPALLPLGLGGDSGKALAALAIGAGAMTVCHVNDDYFWLVANSAGFSPLRGLAAITAGTLLLGFASLAALLIMAGLIYGF